MGRAMTGTRAFCLRFAGLSRPVQLDNAPALMSALCSGLSGWVPSICAADDTTQPLAKVVVRRNQHDIRSIWLNAPLSGLSDTGAFCGLVADLSQSWIAEHPDHMALHAGGVVIDGRVYALSGEARAGKSTLMARLTVEGWARVLCDDVLPVDPAGHGIGLGIPPRLRLPLPGATTATFRAHVNRNLGSFDQQYAYLAASTVAPHGTRAPLAAFVILSRRKTGGASLHPLPQPVAVAHMIARNMAAMDIDPSLIARLTALTNGIACLRLVYSDLEDAVDLLRAFAAGNDPGLIGPPLTGIDEPAPPSASSVSMDRPFRRIPDARLMQSGAADYLWNRAGNTCYALNSAGTAIWTLLEMPTTGDQIVDVLSEIFSDTPAAKICADVAAILAQMAATGLVLPADAA